MNPHVLWTAKCLLQGIDYYLRVEEREFFEMATGHSLEELMGSVPHVCVAKPAWQAELLLHPRGSWEPERPDCITIYADWAHPPAHINKLLSKLIHEWTHAVERPGSEDKAEAAEKATLRAIDWLRRTLWGLGTREGARRVERRTWWVQIMLDCGCTWVHVPEDTDFQPLTEKSGELFWTNRYEKWKADMEETLEHERQEGEPRAPLPQSMIPHS